MAAHARLGPSASARWTACPGSVEAERDVPRRSSFAADEGTAAHELAELLLEFGGTAADWVGSPLPENNAFTVTEEMAEHVQTYVDYVNRLSGEHHYEVRLDLKAWVPDSFGTSDAVVIDTANHTLHVVDLKYGKGVLVDAHENTQAMLYALGATQLLREGDVIHTVRLHIVQPRRDNVSEWELSMIDLLERGEWFKERAAEAVKPDAQRIPGQKQCEFCAVKATCPALDAYTRKHTAEQFEALDTMPPKALSAERLSEILGAKKLIVSWLEAVEGEVLERINRGESVDGWKLVAGRSNRAWLDGAEHDIEQIVGADNAYTRKLITPAQAEKLLGKKRTAEIAHLIVKKDGAPTLAPASDGRAPIGATLADFEAC